METATKIFKKNCRVDVKYINKDIYTFLVDFNTNQPLLCEKGPSNVNVMYSIYSFRVRNGMGIDSFWFKYF